MSRKFHQSLLSVWKILLVAFLCFASIDIDSAVIKIRPVHLQVHTLMSESQLHYKQGQFEAGHRSLQEARKLIFNNPNQFTPIARKKVNTLINHSIDPDVLRKIKGGTPELDAEFSLAKDLIDPLTALKDTTSHNVGKNKAYVRHVELEQLLGPKLTTVSPLR